MLRQQQKTTGTLARVMVIWIHCRGRGTEKQQTATFLCLC